MQLNFPNPQLLGTYHSFGSLGPVYQIIEPIRMTTGGDWLLRIQLIETSEEAEYSYIQALKDPEVH